jgi:chromosome segregation ATPase
MQEDFNDQIRNANEAADEKIRLANEATDEKIRLANEATDEKIRNANEAADEKTRLAIQDAIRLANEAAEEKIRNANKEWEEKNRRKNEKLKVKLGKVELELNGTKNELQTTKVKLGKVELELNGTKKELQTTNEKLNAVELKLTTTISQYDTKIKGLSTGNKTLTNQKEQLSEIIKTLEAALKDKGEYKDASFIRELSCKYFDELRRHFGDLIDPTKQKRASWVNYRVFHTDFNDALRAPSPALMKAIIKITKTELDTLALINDAMSTGYRECSKYIHDIPIDRPVNVKLSHNLLDNVGHHFPKHRDFYGRGIQILHQMEVLV